MSQKANVTIDDLLMSKETYPSSTAAKLFEATGIPGWYHAIKDYTTSYYKSLIKDKPLASKIKNGALAWGSGLAAYQIFYPAKEILQYGVASATGTAISGSYGTLEGAIAGYNILGGSSAGTFLTAIAPYVPFTGLGIYTMYKGFQKENPLLVGAGAAMAFSPFYSIATDYAIGASSLFSGLGLLGTIPVFAGAAILAGATYAIGRRIARWLGFGNKEK